jgi:hypothetical protein
MSTMTMKLKIKNGSKNQKSSCPPSWRAKCRSGVTTLPPVLLQEQPAIIFLLKRALVSWSSSMDEHNKHQDLCGSDRRSIISYIHVRIELYCLSLALPV